MQDGMRQAMVRLSEQYTHLDRVAFNQSNASTPGYKAGDGGVRQGEFSTWLRQESGARVHTGRDLDVALAPDCYLAVQTASGIRYTRRGDLRLDDQSRLVTGALEPVLGENGQPIVVPQGQLHLYRDGRVLDGTSEVGKLARYKISDLDGKSGTLFSIPQNSAPALDETPLFQGELETSNVDVAREQAELIQITNRTRLYGQLVQMQDQTLDKAFRDLGRGH